MQTRLRETIEAYSVLENLIEKVVIEEEKRLANKKLFDRVYEIAKARDHEEMGKLLEEYDVPNETSDDSEDSEFSDDSDEELELSPAETKSEPEDISNHKSDKIIDVFNENNLTPAGQLAAEGNKPAAEFLRIFYRAHIDYIARGAAQYKKLADVNNPQEYTHSYAYVEELRRGSGAMLAECVYGAATVWNTEYLNYLDNLRMFPALFYKPIAQIPEDALVAGMMASGLFNKEITAVRAQTTSYYLPYSVSNKLTAQCGLNISKLQNQTQAVKKFTKKYHFNFEEGFSWSVPEVHIWLLLCRNLVSSDRITASLFLKIGSYFTPLSEKDFATFHQRLLILQSKKILKMNINSIQKLGFFSRNERLGKLKATLKVIAEPDLKLFLANEMKAEIHSECEPGQAQSRKRKYRIIQTSQTDKKIRLFRIDSEQKPASTLKPKVIDEGDLLDHALKRVSRFL